MTPIICLATNEIYPLTHGGCGTLIYNSIYELLAAGHNVWLLADLSTSKLDRFTKKNINHFPNKDKLTIFSVPDYIPDKVRYFSPHSGLAQSKRFFIALSTILDKNPHPDIIEFPDYKGYAYHTLSARKTGILRIRSKIVTRFHLTIELVDKQSVGVNPGMEKCVTYGLERWCLNHTDEVLAPTLAMADFFRKTYKIETPIKCSTPSLVAMGIQARVKAYQQDKILFFSRLAPQKGAELFVNAAVEMLKDNSIQKKPVFIVAGPDMNESPTGGAMIPYLISLVPEELLKFFKFPGYLSHENLRDLLPSVAFAVFPTRQETYCYGARELALAGVPLIVSNIPALKDLVEKKAAVCSSLDKKKLSMVMMKMFKDENFRDRLHLPWNPQTDFLDAYSAYSNESIKTKKISKSKTIHVVIFREKEHSEQAFEATIESINACTGIKIIEAHESRNGDIVLRGRCWKLRGNIGVVNDAICFLEAGDMLPENYLEWAQFIISAYPEVGIVGCSLSSNSRFGVPWDLVPELIPFQHPLAYTRCIIRCDEEIKKHAFDSFWDVLHECAAIWCAISKGLTCLRHPEMEIKDFSKSKVIDKTSLLQPIRYRLVSLFLNSESNLRLLETVKQISLAKQLDTINLLETLRQGNIPVIGGFHLNLLNLNRLAVARLLAVCKNLLTRVKHS